jgi:hypothetical protein
MHGRLTWQSSTVEYQTLENPQKQRVESQANSLRRINEDMVWLAVSTLIGNKMVVSRAYDPSRFISNISYESIYLNLCGTD